MMIVLMNYFSMDFFSIFCIDEFGQNKNIPFFCVYLFLVFKKYIYKK